LSKQDIDKIKNLFNEQEADIAKLQESEEKLNKQVKDLTA
jgi:hypothetical protein